MSEAVKAIDRPAFGVEGLMEKGCQSFFERLFTTRHMGRVIDFFLFEAAQFLEKTSNPVEFEKRVRTCFEMLVFASWAYFRKNEISKWVELEAGWDKNKFVLSVVTYLEPGLEGFFPADGTEPNSNAAKAIRAFLSEVQKNSNGLMVRYHPKSGRTQFLVVFLPNLSGNFKTEFLDLTQASSEQIALLTPLRDAPTALSAGRVPEFLASESEAGVPREVPKVEEIDDSFKAEIAKISEDLVRIRGGASEKETSEKVESGEKEAEHVVRLQGSKEHIKDEVIRVKGGAIKGVDNTPITVTKTEAEEVDESVQLVMNSIRGDLADMTQGLNEDEFQEIYRKIEANVRENYNQTLHHQLRVRSISAVSKVKALKAELDDALKKIDQLKTQVDPSAKPEPESPVSNRDERTTSINKEVEEQEGKFREVMSKYGGAIDTGKIPTAAQEWAKGFMEEALKERAQFNERVREAEKFLRKKEHEYKVQATGFQEQLRLKEEDSKQKEFTIKKTKESLSSAIAALERMKTQNNAQGDQAALSHKLYTAEKLLKVSKDNNERLSKRLEESQSRWNTEFSSRSTAQQELSKANRLIEELKRQVAHAEPGKTAADAAVKAQTNKDNEASQRVVESLKKQIKELQNKLTAAANKDAATAAANKNKGTGGEADVSQLKFKLEHSAKVIKSMKDEIDRYKKRFDELKLQETKMKVELSKLQSQVKTSSAKPMVAGSQAKGKNRA